MPDPSRFHRIREQRRARGLCVRCGDEKAMPGRSIGILCAREIRAKKIVAPRRIYVCEKVGVLEGKRALYVEAIRAIEGKMTALRGEPVRTVLSSHTIDAARV